ncbi:RFX2 [Bugula neritina]|uniref:RFX2 n=1 Tax=Bugula neritina TaxID=10212 RepID=A0A7J7J349_BUGNE|nr:RFX2 [Bugula neritina]
MEDQSKRFAAHDAPKKILVAGPGGAVANPKQFVVTQSKGTTIIQPAAVVHGTSNTTPQHQQYIVTVGAGSHGSQGSDHAAPFASPSVQYLDAGNRPVSNTESIVYTTTQQNTGNVQYQYADGGYSSPAGHYSYSTNNSYHGSGDVIQHMGQTFYLQGGTMDGEGYPLAHTTRAAPATVKWLLENFEPCDGVSLPRSVLYNFYIHHCQTENVEPSNPASFGKLVRMIFRDLKTRRLGQRGNSRYHYYGIRLKPSSGLNQLMPDETPVAMRQPTQPQRRVFKSTTTTEEADSNPVTPKSEPTSISAEMVPTSTSENKHRQYLGTAIDAIPRDIHIVVESNCVPDGINQHDIQMFSTMYREHCELTALTAFSQTLRRYTSLNHLAQAARAVLINSSQIQQMMMDLARVDFSNIQEQAAWVCQCSEYSVRNIETKFKDFLQGEHSLEEWRDWLEKILDETLGSYEGKESYSRAARNFLLKWSFYSSMVIRDLTLRSAVSFGSFHLIRLLYDEYMFYLVEHKVAAATSRTPIAVMAELIENNDQLRTSSRGLPSMASINSGFNGGGGKHTASGFAVTEAGEDDNFTRVKRFKTDDDPLGLAMNNIK